MSIDWNTGSWKKSSNASTSNAAASNESASNESASNESASNESARNSRVTIASDWAPIWDYAEPMRRDTLGIYGDLLPVLQAGDLNIVNVECVLGEKGEPILKGGPNLRGDEKSVDSLTGVPFHIACLANNHTLDFGDDGLEHTLKVLQEAGLKTIGAGMDGTEAARSLTVEVNGLKLGLINCSEGEACCSLQNRPGANGFDVPVLERQIQELKPAVDAVLVIFHGGREHAPLPPPYVVDGLRRLAKAGATAIVAHHPHVPQGIEIYEGVPIAYSQGNFVFRQSDELHFRNTGYLVHLDFNGTALAGLELTPYRLGPDGLSQLKGTDREQLFHDLKTVSEPLADATAVQQAWEAFVDKMGADGIFNQMKTLLQTHDEKPELAAARIHNLFFCPAHRELYLNGLKRLSRGELGNAPEWAHQLVSDWKTRKL